MMMMMMMMMRVWINHDSFRLCKKKKIAFSIDVTFYRSYVFYFSQP